MKLLAWAILIFAVIWVLRSKAKARARSQEAAARAAAQQSSTRSSEPSLETETMVSCLQCGLYFPASEAVHDADSHQTFCSIEHRQLHSGR